MKIGLNLTFLATDSGGSATYAEGLIRGIRAVEPAAEFTAWVGRDAPQEPWLQDVDVIRLPVVGVGGVAHYAWDLAAMVPQARRRGLDVLHGLAFVAPPIHPGLPVVATILDTTWQRYPASMEWKGRVVFGVMSRVLGRTASRVIAISEAGAQDLVTDLGIRRSRIDVTPLAVDPPARREPVSDSPALRERLGIGAEPVVLCVAQKRAHKNLEAAIEALALLDAPAQLVLPGSPNAYEASLRDLAIARGVADRVRFIGWVDDDDLEALYGSARCLVFPSLMEGFGLPLLEAMARDVPVACSNVSALPEVAGDAALLFDPHDRRAIADALRRLLTDEPLRARLVAAGHDRVAAYTWENTARTTLASYAKAIG
ncbi:glycosyltransferase [Conexibacter sp. W3-3-2]|uniref:glycosyltransferase family 4 protein n=1 Tax=Conexibacter sp. W3-3-2 TaxID=2675227 RepID=UPI0012B85F1B|nr:glycosyltransferase family 1 protein [Conexibacter sp. W3-3-2]MTD46219.1 glycosyltransferase [Conexibacter sp. W3-3-2]